MPRFAMGEAGLKMCRDEEKEEEGRGGRRRKPLQDE